MNKQHCIRTVLGITVLAFLCTACAGLGKPLNPPEIKLAGLTVEKTDLFETVLQLTLRVINGNDIPLDIKGIECELEINDKSVASGVSGAAVNIPAFGSNTITVTVFSSAFSIAKTFFGFMQQEMQNNSGNIDLSYRLAGRLHIKSSALLPSTLPFNTTGNLSLSDGIDRMLK